MARRVAFKFVCFFVGVPVYLAGVSLALASETEAHLLARVQKETDPVKKSKGQTRLARIKLEQAIQAYDHGNIEQGVQLVSVYLGRIKDSWQTLRGSGRNAARNPQGFKELDIELREDVRLLNDLGQRVSFYDRAPIEQAGKQLEQVRTEVLQALFPVARMMEAKKPSGKVN